MKFWWSNIRRLRRRAESVVNGSGALTEHQAQIETREARDGGMRPEASIVGCTCGARNRRQHHRYWYAEHVSSVTANYILCGER